MVQAQNPSVKTIKLDDLDKLISAQGPVARVVNFWATWCAPCVKELPLLEELGASNPDIEVLLVSLDLDLDPNVEKVVRFVERKQLRSQVVMLNESDPNSWIDHIDKQWTGAIPATLVINPFTGERRFVEKPLEEGELEKLVEDVK